MAASSWKERLRGWLKQPPEVWILFSVSVLLTLWVYFGKRFTYTALVGSLPLGIPADAQAALYEWLSAFVLMFAVPAVIVRRGFHRSLREFGFQLGDWRTGLKLVALLTPLFLLTSLVGSFVPAMQVEYPLAKSEIASLSLLLSLEAAYLIYYVGWEFLFRGYMLFGLEKPFGVLAAVLIQTIPSTIVHIGKPFSETFSAIFAGLIFGYVAYRSRSIIFPLLLHAVVGISTNVFAVLHALGRL